MGDKGFNIVTRSKLSSNYIPWLNKETSVISFKRFLLDYCFFNYKKFINYR